MKSETRKETYERKRENLTKNCQNCITQSPERCNSCIWGKRIRWLEAEYSDVTGWSHGKW